MPAHRTAPSAPIVTPARPPAADRPVAIVTGALAPYTHVLYEALAQRLDRPLHVLSCSPRETSRQWVLGTPRHYRHEVLPGLRWHRSAVSNLYVNPGVAVRLARLAPAAIVVNDFSPTMLFAAAAARLLGIPYAVRTDGVPETDPGGRSALHALMRRVVVGGAAFGLGPSRGSARLLERYGLAGDRFALSPLFPSWQPATGPVPDAERAYDVMFCGMLNEEVKGARFFSDVVLECSARGRPLAVRVVGDGPLRAEMQDRFARAGIPARFDGFLQQEALEEAYASARLLLFPSRGDVWGIVVQEALQSGTVVLSSPHSGAARELIEAHGCGLVRPLDRATWADAVRSLLEDPARREALRRAGLIVSPHYALEYAARAYVDVLRKIIPRIPSHA